MSIPIPANDWLEAAGRGDVSDLRAWKREGRLGPDAFKRLASVCDTNKNNALQKAIRYGHEEYAMTLVKLGRWPDSMNIQHDSTLGIAVRKNDPEMVQALIDMGHSVKRRPRQEYSLLDIACKEGAGLAGQVLLDNGVKDISYEGLCEMVYLTTRRTTIIDSGFRIYPGEEIKLLEGLFQAGVDPNWTGDGVPRNTCLERWCTVVEQRGEVNKTQIDILRVLLRHGADPEQKVDTGSGGPQLPGVTWVGRDNGLQALMREEKARVSQEGMDQAVAMPAPVSGGPGPRRI